MDEAALRSHLESGHLSGAAVDVYPTAPKARGEEFACELRGLPNVILTPHIGGSTEEAQRSIGRFVAQKLIDFVTTGSTAMSVNLPNLTLPERAGAHRLVHVHRNVPGVLATINGVLAEQKVNIDGQYLATRGEVGYVITDVGTDITPAMLRRLAAMPETIRLRLLP